MKLKKFLLAALAVFSLSAPLASAEIVTVNGSGASETAAINDAKRNAVEQVIGTAIKSRSAMADLQLIFDAIESRTQGYVNSCEVLSSNTSGGTVNVTARVDVSAEPSSALMKDVEVVLNLNDPRLAVVIEHYGDDGGDIFKRNAERCAAAIREELVKRGFTHVVDNPKNIDYVIIGNLSVSKPRDIKIPSWSSITSSTPTSAETFLSKSEAIMDCKIKRVDTDEIIGEAHSSGESIGVEDGLDNQAVTKLAANSAQEVRVIFNREARKIFKSVKLFAQSGDGMKILQLEEILQQTQGVTGVHVRTFAGGRATIDVDTDLSPQNLYRVLMTAVGGVLTLNLQGFTSTTLDLSID